MAINCEQICECIDSVVEELCELDATCPKLDTITPEEEKRWTDYRNSKVTLLGEYRALLAEFCTDEDGNVESAEDGCFEYNQCGVVRDCYGRCS